MDPNLLAKVAHIIKPLIPADAEERVARTVKQSNTAIREWIRSETGLRLSDDHARASIPIKVTDGFSEGLAGLINKHDDPVLWKIIAAQSRLGGVIEGLSFLMRDWAAIERWPRLPAAAAGSESAIAKTLEAAVALQQIAVSKQVTDELRAIHEDILGCYRFRTLKRRWQTWESTPPWIEIYWMPVALIAAMLGVRIEDLTVVILAHELAHGYTHLGKDIDGNRWDDHDFSSAELEVVEGLAQFYTEIVANRLRPRNPGAHEAYEKLLSLQSGPYLAHNEWLKGFKAPRSETVRFAMLAVRGRKDLKHEHWKTVLDETKQKLSRAALVNKPADKSIFDTH